MKKRTTARKTEKSWEEIRKEQNNEKEYNIKTEWYEDKGVEG